MSMPLRKPSGLHRVPKLGGNNSYHSTITPSSKPRAEISLGDKIPALIGGLRHRMDFLEIENSKQKPNAATRRDQYRGTDKRIKELRRLIEKYPGDSSGFKSQVSILETEFKGK